MSLLTRLSHRLKIFLSIGLIFTSLVLIGVAKQTYAQNNWFEPTQEEHTVALEKCAEGDVGLECTVQAIFTGIANSLSYGGTGELAEGPGGTPHRPGAIHFAGTMIGTLLAERPISSGHYVQYVAQRLGVQPAYAQTTGYRALQPLIRIWVAFRNVSYLAFVIIFIAIGFMIMFRARLDPQTVVNIQNSLPKLVVTLILITFSFAIAGFMVDLIYLGIYLLVSVFASQGLISDASQARETLLSKNLFDIIRSGGLWGGGTQVIADAIQGIITTSVEENDLLDTLFGGKLANWLAHTIIVVAILFAMFKLFFQLLIAYVQIVIATLFSPIMILFNALPGSQSFGNWVRNFLANVLIFPAVAAIFLVSAILMGPPAEDKIIWGIETSQYELGYENGGWLPPFVGVTTDTEAVLSLIGFGFILFAPQMVSVLQKALKTQPVPVAGIFAPVAAGAAVVTAPFRAGAGAARQYVGGYISQKGEAAAGEVFPGMPRSKR